MTRPPSGAHPSGDLARFEIHRQPDDTTCGPTCLSAVYSYYGDAATLDELRDEVETFEDGGTLGVLLGTHAVRRGYDVTVITCNLQVFDPTWFQEDSAFLVQKLRARAAARDDTKLRRACAAYIEFIELGGRIELRDLEPALLRGYLRAGIPVLTGLSATFLYREARERGSDNVSDDVAGDPAGHFVVLTGYQVEAKRVLVSDPLYPNPLAQEHTYPVPIQRVIGAVYLGVLTYDANLVVIRPRRKSRSSDSTPGPAPR